MEGKPQLDPRRFAYEEYMNSKEKARYISLAQKLAQHINHLAEDKNTRIRWIWELIQNAKDVPNEFGKCRIRIEIKQDRFIYAHNGDPFRVSDLESLVAQYSSKSEQNKLNIDTTGKYGTGFISTYIISKKIRIKGLLSMKTKEEQLNTKKLESQEEDNIKLISEEQISNVKTNSLKKSYQGSEKQQLHSLQESVNIQEDVQKIMPKRYKLKNFEGGSLYQRFDIHLDREYKDRDKELFIKLMMSQKNLMEDLLKIQPQPKWNRKQVELNTQFIYQDIDQAAHKMINESMAGLKELFPYALLFNPKLFQVQVIDRRKHRKINNFGIKRLPQESFNGFKIFNANILQEGLQKAQKFSLVYIQDKDTVSTIAIPVQIKQNSIKLLEMNSKFPKMFKEFPLIGCKDTGFNFAFTSRRFYTNESRSNLLLEQIQGRDSKKTRANWESLGSIFQKGLQLYKSLSKQISAGQQNLLILSLQNQFTETVFKDKNMYQIYKQYQQEIAQLNCIEFRNKNKGKIKSLNFPFGKSENKKIEDQKYCFQLNSVFAFVLGDGKTLSDQNYKNFFSKFNKYRQYWSKFIESPDIKRCLSQLSKLTFQDVINRSGGNEQMALASLGKIYEFLLTNHPSQITLDPNYQKSKRQQQKFILTNAKKFVQMSEFLFIKTEIPQIYQEIGTYLDININQFTLFDGFVKYFTTVKNFGIPDMVQSYKKKWFKSGIKDNPQNLILLGRFLATFNIKSDAIEIAQQLKHLSCIGEPLQIKGQKHMLKLDQNSTKQFKILFEIKLMLYIDKLMQDSQNLPKMMQHTQFDKETQKAIQWLNTIFKLQEELLKFSKSPEFIKGYSAAQSSYRTETYLLQRNLSLSLKFVRLPKLRYFSTFRDSTHFKGNYPDKHDFQIYEKMKSVQNRRPSNEKYPVRYSLEDQILHELIHYKLPEATTFKHQFKFILQIYNNKIKVASSKDKILILDYIFHLRQTAIKNRQLEFKVHIFYELERRAYYQYPSLTNCIESSENQIYTFSFIKNEEEITLARQLTQEYGSLRKAFEIFEGSTAKSQRKDMKI